MTLPLFAYGTLRDPDYQRELFARTYPMKRAVAIGFIAVVAEGGYLAAMPRDGARIEGALVEFDAAGYAIADAWEDLAVYDRIEIEAMYQDGRPQRCFIYVQTDAQGPPVTDERLADRSRAEVVADIRRFRATLDLATDGK